MFRAIRILLQSLLLICPACGRGRMFRSLAAINPRCPNCGLVFEHDTGEVTGGMAINMVATSVVAVVLGGVGVFAGLPTLPLLLGLGLWTLLFPLWFYRHARGLWIGMIYLSGSITER